MTRDSTSTLLLAKHAAPEIRREVPPPQWRLSARGRAQAALLAETLRGREVQRIVTSSEPKARESGEIIAAALAVPVHERPGLHEHERVGVPYFDALSELHAHVRALFAHPDDRVFGSETGAAARARFSAALQAILREDSRQPALVVAHGTVISLAVAAANGLDGFAFWEGLGLGDLLVLDARDLTLREHVRLAAPP